MSRMCCLLGQKYFSLSSTLFCLQIYLINAQHTTTKMFERCFKHLLLDNYCGGNQQSYLSPSRKPYITIHFYVDYCLHNCSEYCTQPCTLVFNASFALLVCGQLHSFALLLYFAKLQ